AADRPVLPRLPAHGAPDALRVPGRLAAAAAGRGARQRRCLLEPRVLALHDASPHTVPAHRDDWSDAQVVSLDRETGRDRYFEERERELEALRGRAVSLREVDCPLCGSAARARLFEKHGFTFVRCRDCGLVFVNPQLEEAVVLEEYRTAATNDLLFYVVSSARQQERSE